ncbi:hypothetical protein [Gordonia pseudamarae]|uniref:hypothetical protein n=1 Tax=Gordonia pseudamarae TaxID=2831662 RepID=UPI001AF8E316|nr:hypothetical protein [Gordonia pseudamarae]QHN28976.1 hypothetical protein GII33_23120 [Gordonia pseudamarae]
MSEADWLATDVDEQPVLVCSTAGGTGVSVLSALLADRRARSGLGSMSWWVDCAPGDSDLPGRMGVAVDVDGEPVSSSVGATIWRPSPSRATPFSPISPESALKEATSRGAVPVLDTGSSARSVVPLLADNPAIVPVLVLGARPDLLNRARPVLTEWAAAGVLARTVLILNGQVPLQVQQHLSAQVTNALAGWVRVVITIHYDQHLGAGGALSPDRRDQLSTQFMQMLGRLSAATVSPALSQAKAV